eukprot:CAMPEP_0182839528 /NCGR_PEP_ID=MMETSP0006_2-20121128/23913_1 /TAXON_ID=97485 /ORGANISM="Prymnesium parvum, Strain Texoma1" /LENGTH=94 /DNA_ID=CAMNT_0024968681 /DNA_START=514 /DNA_END=795 /DNA_ORIENTATION=-
MSFPATSEPPSAGSFVARAQTPRGRPSGLGGLDGSGCEGFDQPWREYSRAASSGALGLLSSPSRRSSTSACSERTALPSCASSSRVIRVSCHCL